MKQNAKALYGRFEKSVWGVAETPLPLWKERAQRGLRTVFILTRDLVGGQLTLRAMSLVYHAAVDRTVAGTEFLGAQGLRRL